MNELIPVIINEETKEQLVSARELHKGLELKTRFSSWIEQYIKEDNKYGFQKDRDFCYVAMTTHQNQYGGEKEIDNYILNIDMAKEIAMLTFTEKGREVRRYFIACEKELKEMHFKAIEIFNRRSTNYSFTDFANLCCIKGLGRNNMLKWAESEDIIFRKFDEWRPYRVYIEQGYFEVKETWNKKINKYIKTIYITPKGAVWLHKKLRECGYSPKSMCEIVLDSQAEQPQMAFGNRLKNI